MPYKKTYAADVAFLKKHTEIVELGAGAARVAVAPQYQGRVMTSTLAGGEGASFGWINERFIKAGKDDPVFNNYGGEDRFWLGPEAGQFGLWFKSGEPFDLAHWKTPPGFNTGAFEVSQANDESVAMTRAFDVTNYAGTTFRCQVSRTINAIAPEAGGKLLGLALPQGAAMVGFESVNVLTNAGEKPWSHEGGMVSIWILGMFRPLPRGKVIVPFVAGDDGDLGPKATTNYFGDLPAERCSVKDDHLLFACDGAYRSKIGISPARAKDALGSYDPDAGVLTIVRFNLPAGAARRRYVNSLWEFQDRPFAGDAVNSYNDGEPEPGAGQLGPFYEIETSSPAAELAAGESVTHVHRTFHLSAPLETLNDIARKALGVDLTEVL